eukprot:SAG31_NODE_30665_length_377_cov_2.687050_1_plen_45_part_10
MSVWKGLLRAVIWAQPINIGDRICIQKGLVHAVMWAQPMKLLPGK